MKELIKEILIYLLENYNLYVFVALVISMSLIIIVLNLLKKPIKKLTSKIKDERLRKLANKSIILLSFGLSALGWVILNLILPNYFEINMVLILLDGAFPVVIYALQDGVITKDKALSLVETLEDITKDGEVTKKEVKEVIEKELKDTAEDELNKLLK